MNAAFNKKSTYDDARHNDGIADISLTGGEQKKMRRRTRYGQVVRALSRSIEQICEQIRSVSVYTYLYAL